jgi:acyl-CoA synthetase (AMP-forming)/AMP-acid ligase II
MPLPFAQLQIRDESNKPGTKDRCVLPDNPEATAERIVDGWVKSGAIGRLDADGYLCMLDRADDVVIGFNIYPAEPENMIAGLRHSR